MSALNFSGIEGVLIGVVAILFFLVRQFSTRRVLSLANVIIPIALLYFGIQGLNQLDSVGWLVLGFSISLAIALGVARGVTFRVWTDERGQQLMRGGALTLAIWLVTIAVRAAITFGEVRLGLAPAATSPAELWLPAAATIAAQLLVVYLRAQDQLHLVSYRLS
jgi:hypothetical protein